MLQAELLEREPTVFFFILIKEIVKAGIEHQPRFYKHSYKVATIADGTSSTWVLSLWLLHSFLVWHIDSQDNTNHDLKITLKIMMKALSVN